MTVIPTHIPTRPITCSDRLPRSGAWMWSRRIIVSALLLALALLFGLGFQLVQQGRLDLRHSAVDATTDTFMNIAAQS